MSTQVQILFPPLNILTRREAFALTSKARAQAVCAGVAQLVERQPSKLNVAGSIPVSRSQFYISRWRFGAVSREIYLRLCFYLFMTATSKVAVRYLESTS